MNGKSLRALLWVVLIVVLVLIGVFALQSGEGPTTAPPPGATSPQQWTPAQQQFVRSEYEAAAQFMDKGKFDEARRILEAVIDRFPNDPEGLNLLAKTQVGQEQIDAAYQTLLDSLKLNPDQPEMHFVAGVLASKRGEHTIATGHFVEAFERDRKNPKYTLYLANAYLKIEDPDSAQLYALKTLQLDPSLTQAYVMLSNIAADKGQVQRAIEQVDKALNVVGPEHEDYPVYLIQKLKLLRRAGAAGREEALNVLASLPAELQTEQRIVDEWAMTYLSLDQPAEAAKLWERRFEAYPLDAVAAAEAGLAWYRAGELEKARGYLRKAQMLKPHINEVRALEQALRRAENAG
jgi:tetratricopeptide (TPR) repeat protein